MSSPLVISIDGLSFTQTSPQSRPLNLPRSRAPDPEISLNPMIAPGAPPPLASPKRSHKTTKKWHSLVDRVPIVCPGRRRRVPLLGGGNDGSHGSKVPP